MHIVHELTVNETKNEDGEVIDLLKDSPILYGVVGLMFSVEDFDRDI